VGREVATVGDRRVAPKARFELDWTGLRFRFGGGHAVGQFYKSGAAKEVRQGPGAWPPSRKDGAQGTCIRGRARRAARPFVRRKSDR
jgi:hypothetical protein